MQTNPQIPGASHQDGHNLPRWLHLCFIVTGYLVMAFGALSTFRLPLHVTLLTVLLGGGIVTLASRHGYAMTRFTWRTGLLWLAGCVVIWGALLLIGEDKLRHWTPHPAGYQTTWFICIMMFRHLRQIFHQESAPTAA